MPTLNVGRVRFVLKGTWAGAPTTYELFDVVDYNGSSYVAKQAVPVNTAPPNTTYWELLAQAGVQSWGEIGGTLSNQTDLQNALNAKLANIVEDLTPQLGGPLSTNGHNITMTAGETVDGRDISADGAALDSAVADQHTHSNKAILDATTASYTIAEETQLAALPPNGINASDVDMQAVGTPTYPTLQDMNNQYHSSGWITGGGFTASGGGATLDVAAGSGWIKSSQGDLSPLLTFDWPEALSLPLIDNSFNYIYVEYNGGVPQVVSTGIERTDYDTNILLGGVYREGLVQHVSTHIRWTVANHASTMIKRLHETAPFARASGGIVTETGTRNIAVTAGVFWEGLNRFTTSAKDTSVADTISCWYRDGVGGWTETTTAQINNTQYDNGTGTLANLSNNKYGVHWIYIASDSDIHCVYGQGDYTLAEAESAAAPSSFPDHFNKHVRLAAKIVIQQNAATFTSISSAFSTSFATGGTVNAPVDSVNGKTGIVIIDKADVGLGNVDNTSDADKPVSTAQQSALDLKVNNSDIIDEDDMISNLDTKVPTQQSVKAYVDGRVASQLVYSGSYDAATNTPDLDVSPSGVLTGFLYTVTVAGNFFTEAVEIGDVLIAEQDNPTLLSHWTIVNKNLDASSILAALTTVDGTGSGLDADTVDGIEGDYIDLTLHAMTEVQYNALADRIRHDMAGSGFVEFGKHGISGSIVVPINEGLYSYTSGVNALYLGRGPTAPFGTSKTESPIVNVNGAIQKIHFIGQSGSVDDNIITLPAAPTATNLVTNGTFDTDTTGWTAGDAASGLSVVSNRLRLTNNDATQSYTHQALTTVVGQTYLVEVEYVAGTSQNYNLLLGTSAGGTQLHPSVNASTGVLRVEFTATTTTSYIALQTGTTTNTAYGDFDNISVIDKADLSRQDLVFLESWHEKISDKDVVYPYGNVQFGATTFGTLTSTQLKLSTTLSIGQGYGAFGEWDTTNRGYAAVWSTLSATHKREMIANRWNNIYLADDGEYVQIRYRVRVVKGLGDSWSNKTTELIFVESGTAYLAETGGGGDNYYLAPQGKRDTADDLRSSWPVYGRIVGDTQIGEAQALSAAGVKDVNSGYNGLCFAVPIALVQRRNQGAFHNVLNENGCSRFEGSDNSADYFYESGLSVEPKTTFDCFYEGVNGSSGVSVDSGGSPNTGYISSALSGRPDGLFYDAIYAEDVDDLRNSARPVTDLKRTLEREFNKAVAGELRGWEGEYSTEFAFTNTADSSSAYTAGSFLRLNFALNTLDSTHARNTAAKGFEGRKAQKFVGAVIGKTTGTVWPVVEVNPNESSLDRVYLDLSLGDIRTTLDAEASFDLVLASDAIDTSGRHSAETILHCDIIGDPANYFRGHYDFLSSSGVQTVSAGTTVVYVDSLNTGTGTIGNFYQSNAASGSLDLDDIDFTVTAQWTDLGTDRAGSWVTEGVFGTPLLVDESGNSLIPDGTSKTYKMSRKVNESSPILYLGSNDGGQTWTDYTASALPSWSATANAYTFSTATGYLRLAFYTTKANPTELASNSEVLSIADAVFAGNSYSSARGSEFISHLIGKVPVDNTSPYVHEIFETIISKGIDPATGLFWTQAGKEPKHGVIDLDGTGPTAKVAYYLSRLNGRLMMHLIYKEMKYDSTADSPTDVITINAASSFSVAANDLVVLRGFDNPAFDDLVVIFLNATSTTWPANTFNQYYITPDGVVITSAGAVWSTAKVWDGNGWGDDNKFTVLDNESTETDDNANTIIVGQRKIELPHFIRDDY